MPFLPTVSQRCEEYCKLIFLSCKKKWKKNILTGTLADLHIISGTSVIRETSIDDSNLTNGWKDLSFRVTVHVSFRLHSPEKMINKESL